MKSRIWRMLVALLMALVLSAPAVAEIAQPQGKAVVRATKIKLNRRSATLKVGKLGARGTLQLSTSILPKDASAKDDSLNLVVYRTSNSKIATVDSKTGLVTPVKPGKATISAVLLDGSKKKAKCTVTVKGVVPSAVKLSAASLGVGETKQLDVEITPSDAWNQKAGYASSNKRVAKVSQSGVVKAIKPGKATISVKTKSGGRTAKCTVTVTEMPGGAQPNYRFFGIGNGNYRTSRKLSSCLLDVEKMRALYAGASFGGTSATASKYTDLSGAGIERVLQEMVSSGIRDTDVTIFYYSGHGLSANVKEYRGALLGVDEIPVTVGTVQSYLDRVPGRVIVILDSCLSGQFIESKGLGAAGFNQAVIDSFSGSGADNFAPTGKALTGSSVSGKYKILTACRPLESSYSFTGNGKDFGLFTQIIKEGLSGSSPAADKDKDKRVSLGELYSYTNAGVSSYIKKYNSATGDKISQTVAVWPAGDGSTVFARN